MEVRLSDDSRAGRDYTDGGVTGGEKAAAPVVLRDTRHGAPLSGAATIWHAVRTPLNAELGFAQVLQLDGLSPWQGASARQVLGGRRLPAPIDEVPDVARSEVGRLERGSAERGARNGTEGQPGKPTAPCSALRARAGRADGVGRGNARAIGLVLARTG